MIEALRDQIDSIESGYEFLLAYAAQGRISDEDSQSAPKVRTVLTEMLSACDAIIEALQPNQNNGDSPAEFAQVIVDDGRKARAALLVVLAHTAISSELVDNLNASIHLRALLTDLFLVSST